jgi:hypothetical protein
MNPFTLIPANVRRIVYIVYGTVTLALTMIGAGYASAGQTVPTVLTAAGAALVPLGAALAAVAASNTNASTAVVDDDSPTGEVAGEASDIPTGTPVTVEKAGWGQGIAYEHPDDVNPPQGNLSA